MYNYSREVFMTKEQRQEMEKSLGEAMNDQQVGLTFKEAYRRGYQNGVEFEQQRAQVLVEALKNIKKENDRFANTAVMDWDRVQTEAYVALAQYQKGGGDE